MNSGTFARFVGFVWVAVKIVKQTLVQTKQPDWEDMKTDFQLLNSSFQEAIL